MNESGTNLWSVITVDAYKTASTCHIAFSDLTPLVECMVVANIASADSYATHIDSW